MYVTDYKKAGKTFIGMGCTSNTSANTVASTVATVSPAQKSIFVTKSGSLGQDEKERKVLLTEQLTADTKERHSH